MRTVSIIIPTYNRAHRLQALLISLQSQSYPASHLEVVVVCDGCTDNSIEILQNFKTPFSMQVKSQPHRGAAAARNYGAQNATGELLIFIDDDVEPISDFVKQHLAVHSQNSDKVCIGHKVCIGYLPIKIKAHNLYTNSLRSWWELQFTQLRCHGHRFNSENLFSGNFSIESNFFNAVGGFDASLPRREDFEFGLRLIRAGAIFEFASGAIAYHNECSDVTGHFRRLYQEGIGDVLMGRRHPALRPTLTLAKVKDASTITQKFRHALIFTFPRLGNAFAHGIEGLLIIFEALRFRVAWQNSFNWLRCYWYLRGASTELVDLKSISNFFQDFIPYDDRCSEIEIDISIGLQLAEDILDEKRPESCRLRYKGHIIGRIPGSYSEERLRGRHLRRMLGTTFLWTLLRILINERALYADRLTGPHTAPQELE